MDGLHFDPDRHAYQLDGAHVPGVTSALKVVSSADYAGVDPEVMARKAAIGTAVHRVIELDCLDDLDTDSLDSVLVPYYQAWRSFLLDAMAKQTVKAGGIGLADTVMSEMLKMQEQAA